MVPTAPEILTRPPKPGKIVQVQQVPFRATCQPIAHEGDVGVYAGFNKLLTTGGLRYLEIHAANKHALSYVRDYPKGLREEIAKHARTHIDTTMVRGRQWMRTGSDPEVFVVDAQEKVIPAWEFLPAKASSGYQNNHEAYWDGFQAEFMIAADTCHEAVVDNIQAGLSNTLRRAQEKFPTAKLTWQPVLEVPNDVLRTADRKYVDFGCSPSKNGYSRDRVLEGVTGRELAIRFAGFHIHLGIPDLSKALARHIVRQIDRVTGVLMVAVLDGMDNPLRRRFYGLAGEYRLPSHGVEYRTLSAATMAHPAITHLALDTARLTAMYAISGISLIEEPNEVIKECINNCDTELARKLLDKHKDFYASAFSALYGPEKQQIPAKLAHSGAKELIPITNMETNWYYGGGWQQYSRSQNACINYLNI